MKYKEFFLVLLILLGGFFVRMYRFDGPIGDWHSWRQADTSAVSRDFVTKGFIVFQPTFEDISNIPSGLDNPHGYRFVEFPIYNIFQAGLFKTFGVLTIEEWGRLITIFASLGGSLCLYILVKRRNNQFTAFFVLLFSVFIPYNIYYGRTILPDTSMVATFLAGLLFLDIWLDGIRRKERPNIIYLLISLLFTVSSFLLKAYTIFYGLTYLALLFSVLQFKMFKRVELYIYAIFSILPLILWRKYMLSYPSGIPVNAWLFNGNGIRFRPSFFRWIFYERLTKLISGYVGTLFLATGLVKLYEEKKDRLFFFSFIISALTYICVVATGNVQHDYYQIVIMPVVSIVMGFGLVYIYLFLKKRVGLYVAMIIVGITMVSSFWFAWQQVKDYFNINNSSMIVAGVAVDKLIPKNALVIAPLDGDTSFLYQTKRKGWPSFEHSLPELIKLGANYLVLLHPTKSDEGLGETYKIVSETSDYILFDLHKTP